MLMVNMPTGSNKNELKKIVVTENVKVIDQHFATQVTSLLLSLQILAVSK